MIFRWRDLSENSIHTPSKQNNPRLSTICLWRTSYFIFVYSTCGMFWVWNGLFWDCQQTCRFFLHNRDRDIQAILQSCLVRIGVNGNPISALPYEMFRGSFTLILTRYLECLGVVYVFFSYGMTAGCYVTWQLVSWAYCRCTTFDLRKKQVIVCRD